MEDSELNYSYENRTVIVTGGSCGIGAAISRAFAAEGANVLVNHLPSERDTAGMKQLEKEVKDFSGSCISVPGDITSKDFCEQLCRTAREKFGSLDVLVNSAGFTKAVTTLETSEELWNTGISVNLSAAFYLAKAAVPYLAEGSSGRIVFIGSAGSITGGGGAAFYSAAKAGINGLVRYLSKDLAPKGITVNAVLPALIDTELLRGRHDNEEKRKALTDRIPVGRLGTPEDVANLVLFLSSGQAGFICGQQVIVDGGSTYK